MAKLIGTAGHVDHGKTSLIRALTGIDADRLPEEKARGMTIDIGFAYVDLPNAGRVSIVDVPGHEKFLTNMLVGALGIDVALLCVAADESVMPQTREHLQILELLPVDSMIVALTRSDLVDQEMQELVSLEVLELLAETRFANSKIIPVSVVTGTGIEDLRGRLDDALQSVAKVDDEPWYMPIDRVFTVKGHGAVVTGTFAQGIARLGDTASIEPVGLTARIRSIHSHSEALMQSERGKRTALNISGVRAEDLVRGMQIGRPGAVFPTKVFDAKVKVVVPLKHALRVRVSIGAEEAIGKVFLNENNPELVQLRLESEVACSLNQPVIIRRYSPPDVLAGGRVTVPQAQIRRKTEETKAVSSSANIGDAILEVIAGEKCGISTDEICRRIGRSKQDVGQPFEDLLTSGSIEGFAGHWFGKTEWQSAADKLVLTLDQLHMANPTFALLPREKVIEAAGFKWSGKPLERIIQRLSDDGQIAAQGPGIKSATFSVQLNPKQRALLDRVKEELDKGGINSPNPETLANSIGVPVQAVDEMFRLGADAKEIVRLPEGVHYSTGQLASIQKQVEKTFADRGFTAGEFRDAFQSSRKYVIVLLEYFDSIGFTIRVGNQRKIRK